MNYAELALADIDSGSSAKASGSSQVPQPKVQAKERTFPFNCYLKRADQYTQSLVKLFKQRRSRACFIGGTHLLEEACAVDYPLVTVFSTQNGTHYINNFGKEACRRAERQKSVRKCGRRSLLR